MKQFAAAILVCFSMEAYTETLTLYSWEDYIAPTLVEQWEKETGHKIKQVYFDSDEQRDEVLGSSSDQTFDLAVFDSVSVQLFGKNNRLAAISSAQLSSLRDIAPIWKESCGNFGMPYLWGTLGIIYHKDKVKPAPSSWGDLLKPAQKQHGHITMLDDGFDTLAPALLYAGRSINSEDKQVLEAAFNLLKTQTGKILGYDYLFSFIDKDRVAPELHMALGYSGDQHVLNEKTGNDIWHFVAPSEGTALWVDCMSIMEKSPHKELAYHFLNFINQAEHAAINSAELEVATPNQAALVHLPPTITGDPTIFPPATILEKSQFYRILSDENMSLRGRIVNALIKYHDAQ